MNDFKIDTLINRDDIYKEEYQYNNTFRSVDELMCRGINRNTIYREESMRKRRNEHSYRGYLCKTR